MSIKSIYLHTLGVKGLVSDLRLSFRGWSLFILGDENFVLILLTLSTSTMSRGHPRTDLAFLITLYSFFLSAIEMLLPQQT